MHENANIRVQQGPRVEMIPTPHVSADAFRYLFNQKWVRYVHRSSDDVTIVVTFCIGNNARISYAINSSLCSFAEAVDMVRSLCPEKKSLKITLECLPAYQALQAKLAWLNLQSSPTFKDSLLDENLEVIKRWVFYTLGSSSLFPSTCMNSLPRRPTVEIRMTHAGHHEIIIPDIPYDDYGVLMHVLQVSTKAYKDSMYAAFAHPKSTIDKYTSNLVEEYNDATGFGENNPNCW